MPASRSSAPRYAPEDPTLPKPWKELIDGVTGYHYFWNPESNVTQYERPADDLPPPPPRKRSIDDRRGYESSKTAVRGNGDAVSTVSAEAYRRQHEISITGEDVPAPYTTFESTGFNPELLREVHHAGFSAPTPIQAQAWPIALRGRDVVAVAKTGSGKTLGYLFPGFSHLKNLRNNTKLGPTVLVLAPTRELATQIQEEALKFGRSSRISCTCLYGGAPKGPQLRDLDRGVDVVVATPGRLNDILEMRKVSLRQVSYLVLDEADRMLDMGFEPQIRKIVAELPRRRQTLMFTATWPKEVEKIAAELLTDPVQVNIGSVDELVANKAITQHVEVMTKMDKQRRLDQILHSQDPHSKIIIFCSTKRMCDELSRTLNRKFGAAAIHGDKSQVERDRVLGQFRSGRSPILVATDVASRGLDIKDIRVVINFDFPTDIEDYVHRIGRTGRAGATGISYTFFSEQDSKYASDLIKVLEGSSQHVPPELRDMSRRGGYGNKRRRWATTGPRDNGRSHGGRNDSSYGGRGGWGQPSSGRFDGGRGARRDVVDEPRHRYGRGSELGARDLRDTKVIMATSDRRVRGKSPSRSPSPKRRYSGLGRSRSRSRSRSMDHGRSRSRSLGRNRGFGPARRQSPPLDKKEPSTEHHASQSIRSPTPPIKREPSTDHHTGKAVHSPAPHYDNRQRSPYEDAEGMEDVRHDPTPSPLNERSRSSYSHNDNGDGDHGASLSPDHSNHRRSPHSFSEVSEGADKKHIRVPLVCAGNGEEVEEGMIPADED